jgi:hypothetical protein
MAVPPFELRLLVSPEVITPFVFKLVHIRTAQTPAEI